MDSTPESVYESFWKDLVETDGVMDPAKVKAELFDYRMVMQNATKVYLHITNGKIGKLNTDPDIVCSIADEEYDELYDGGPCDCCNTTKAPAAGQEGAQDADG